MIHERFQTYFKENFFQDKEEEFKNFLTAIEQPIPRTIRIKPGKITEVKTHLENDGWILDTTPIEGVFSLGRKENFDPLERRIGYSIDHLIGNFYIQELAAAHPVSILADQKIQEGEYLILDMASSPGGKTTQLAEFFPNSFIIANEPTRERIPQLLQNLDRMGSANIGVTLYPGQYWKNYRETFDKILLDAPCSGEGTLYKGTDATKHWHIKNIKMIAKLQEKLLDASLHALKVGGEMIYSTCSLNLLENEGVVNTIAGKYPGTFEITYQKKFWPHIDKTGGFFVTKIKKIQSIESKGKSDRVENTNKDLGLLHGNIGNWKTKSDTTLFEHTGKILAVKNSVLSQELRKHVYFMRYGEYIGSIVKGVFIPAPLSYRHLDIDKIPELVLKSEEEIDLYLRGNALSSTLDDGYCIVRGDTSILGLEQVNDGMIENNFPSDWQRK